MRLRDRAAAQAPAGLLVVAVGAGQVELADTLFEECTATLAVRLQPTHSAGILIAGLCLGVQAWAIDTGHAHWQTMVFTVLTLAQMAHLMAIRSEGQSIWSLGLRSNLPLMGAVALTFALQLAVIYVPVLQPIFRTEALNGAELALCLACAALVTAAVEAEKAWRRRV